MNSIVRKIVLVTGSNRGIGHGIIEGLLEQTGKYNVILTSRNEKLGQESYKKLLNKFPNEKNNFYYHQLDITKEDSITNLIKWIKDKFQKINYLVNNAGVIIESPSFNIEQTEFVFRVNVYGTINFTETMIKDDMINKKGKILFLGSSWGSLSYLRNKNLVDSFRNAKTREDLLSLADRFKTSIKNNTIRQEGWYHDPYYISKMIINTYPKVLSFRKEIINNEIGVYACDPGWVRTDMGGKNAPSSIKEGASNELHVIGLPDGIQDEYQGKYFSGSRLASF